MTYSAESTDALWHKHDTFDVPPTEAENLCRYAQDFTAWFKESSQGALRQRTVIAINQAILLLTHQYFSYKNWVPKAHRHHFSDRGHICIFHVFERAFHRLNAELLRLNPPVLTEPPLPQPPPLQLAGMTWGESLKKQS